MINQCNCTLGVKLSLPVPNSLQKNKMNFPTASLALRQQNGNGPCESILYLTQTKTFYQIISVEHVYFKALVHEVEKN